LPAEARTVPLRRLCRRIQAADVVRFPSTAEELTVLTSALQANPNDASAHYLLGTLYFSRGLTDSALTEWAQAGKLNPAIPVLDASVGLALLHEKNDFEGALSAFRRGLSSDPSNIMTYVGTDQALSLLGKTAGERVRPWNGIRIWLMRRPD